MPTIRKTALALTLFLAATLSANAQMVASLTPSSPSPIPLGTIVRWTADVTGASPGTLWYRFRVGHPAGNLRLIRDFGPESVLDWAEISREGMYTMEVAVLNRETREMATTSLIVHLTSRIVDKEAVVNPTGNPLVFLYSAPHCASGGRMRVEFTGPDGATQRTNYADCHAGSMNFYLAGMRANTAYKAHHVLETASGSTNGPDLTLTTGDLPITLAPYNVLKPAGSTAYDILLQSTLSEPTVATDLAGNPVWFYANNISSLTRAEKGGRFFGLLEDPSQDQAHQLIREFDLAGITRLETNAARVSEMLVERGMRPISSFHHEVRALPGGHLMVLAAEEQLLTGVQGDGTVDVIGDVILVFDRDFQLTWAWDSFDHLDVHRMATLSEICTPGGGGCPPFYLAPQANDWLHGNSLQLTPDGNLLYSSRHQDWVIKIDFNNGQGTGNVIWRLGKDGDFQIVSNDPNPWFSHQHDPGYEPGSTTNIVLFDDGNVRWSDDKSIHSRGQVLQIDEQNRTAKLLLNADLGGYSFALGSAAKLANGNYHFLLGWLPDGSSTSIEVNPFGDMVYGLNVATPVYRSYRMKDLYTPN